LQATVQNVSINVEDKSSDTVSTDFQELDERDRLLQQEAEEDEEVLESQVPYNIEDLLAFDVSGSASSDNTTPESQSDNQEEVSEVVTDSVVTDVVAGNTESVEAVTTSEADAETTESIEGETTTETEATAEEIAEAEAVVAQPVATTPRSPEEDPNFTALTEKVEQTSKGQQKHIPSDKASKQGQAAAKVPAKERESKAQQNQVGDMDEQEPKKFKAEVFKAQLKKRIAAMQLPKNEEEADDFENNNNIDEVTEEGVKDAKSEKEKAGSAIENTTQKTPDIGKIKERAADELPKANPGKKPGNPKAGNAMPPQRGDSEVSQPLQENMQSLEDEMQNNDVTDEQLQKANEPDFTLALNEKNAAKQHTENAPTGFRKEETDELQKSQASADSKGGSSLSNMHASRTKELNNVFDAQGKTGETDTAARQKVIDDINGIYEKTKKEVTDTLDQLEADVETKFNDGAEKAKKAFEDHVAAKMKAYKKERYGESWYDLRNLRRVGDAVLGLPKEVNAFFVSGRKVYINTMDIYITEIANLVANQLNLAKTKISNGKREVDNYVKNLEPSLQKVGKDAAKDIQSKFDSLESSVDSKQDALIDSLAQQYMQSLESVDARIEEMKEANKGLVDKAWEAGKKVWETIKQVKEMLTKLIQSAIDVITAIIADPIGFLSNLISGITQGFTNFGKNIVKHLQAGLIGWLTGTLGPSGITLPENLFSLKGIFSLLTQVLGFTWDRIRNAGRKVLGEPIMKALETGFELVTILKNEGLAGLWQHIKEQFTDLKETVMGAIEEMVITQVIKAGITWVLGLLNPAGAFVKAAMAIISVVKFFIERAAQIMELVKAFIEAISAIASGSVQKVAGAIENALAKALPVVIGFLAALLGLGGLAGKVIGLIRKLQARVEKALISLWKKIKKLAGKFINKIKSKLGFGKKEDKDKKLSPEERKAQVKEGLASIDKEEKKYLTNGTIEQEDAEKVAKSVENQHPVFKYIKVVDGGDSWDYDYKVNPSGKKKGEKKGNDIIEGRMLDGSKKVHPKKGFVYADTEKRQGNQVKGYKVKEEDSANKFDGIIVGKTENNYIREREEKEDFLEEFNILKGKTVEKRRIHIDKVAIHTDFKPKKIDFNVIGKGKVQVKYFYEKEAHENGRQDFTITISLDSVEDRKVTQTTEGENLALKVPGTRGHTDSAGIVARKDFGIDLNSAHILGDQFLGSGYKNGLNLILTSKEFNQITMKNAETQIQDSIKQKMKENSDKFVTFDMTVSATFEVLEDDELIDTLEKVHGEMSEKAKIETLEKLQGKQDPRRIEVVFYKAKIKDEQGNIIGTAPAQTEHGDDWLNDLFKN